MSIAMNTQHFFNFLLQHRKALPIYEESIGDEDWFTGVFIFSIDAPVSISNGNYSLIQSIPEQIEKFNIQIALNSRSQYNNRSKVIKQDLTLAVDLTAFKSFDQWSTDLLIKLQDMIFNDGIYNSSCIDALEGEFKQAYQEWSAETPTTPMSYTPTYNNHIFNSATLMHEYIVSAVQEFTKPNNRFF